MLFLPLGVVALISSLVLFIYAQIEGGSDAAIEISGQVITGTMLRILALMVAIAGALFIISAVIKTIRRVAAIAASIAILTSGGIGAFAPIDALKYELEHGCEQLTTVKSPVNCKNVTDQVSK